MHPTNEYLTFHQLAEQYPGTATQNTLRTWYLRNTHNFRSCVTKVGSSVRVRRDHWEKFLDEGRCH